MSWTKKEFVLQALDEIGFASYDFNLTAEEIESHLRRLDMMMANWNGKGIRIGYPLPSSPKNGLISDETNVPDSANEAIYTNLAIRVAPSHGKQVSIETKQVARIGYQTLLSRAVLPNEMRFGNKMPLGAGNKPWRYWDDPFVRSPKDLISVGADSFLDVNGNNIPASNLRTINTP